MVPFDVPSPLGSPLVARWGALELRGGAIFRSWRQVTVVFTVAGVLHVFEPGDDLATSKDGLESGAPAGVRTLRPVEVRDGAPDAAEEAHVWSGVFPPGRPFGGVVDVPDKDAKELVRKWNKRPAQSVPLCGLGCDVAVTPKPDIDANAFEIEQSAPGVVFRSSNKLTFRAPSSAELVKWLERINKVAKAAGTLQLQ